MQQGGDGGGGSKSQYGGSSEMGTTPALDATSAATTTGGHQMGMDNDQAQLQVEAASPISCRPPASAAVNLDELMALQGGGADEDALAAGAGDGGGVGGGNRWPRQETLALLKIRSEMDAVFRDASLKGPLWEDISRKLGEMGYKRSAKKCKEKFENVDKYYKRTKESRAGRQDGKSYKFFSELEALHGSFSGSSAAGNSGSVTLVVPPATTTFTTIHPMAAPVSTGIGIGGIFSNPMPITSIRVNPQVPPGFGMFPPNPSSAAVAPAPVSGSIGAAAPPIGVSFSSNSLSSSPGSHEDDDDEEESLEAEPLNLGSSRKRKRRESSKAGGSSDTRRMMAFFQNLMKQVMHKQEAMQQRFLEVMEKREQDRMIREEAWNRQEMARLAREHELMAQDRATSASRDAAIVGFLQKITGHSIQLPTHLSNTPAAPPPALVPSPMPAPPPQPPSSQQKPQQQQVLRHSHRHTQVVMAIPEQQVPPQDISGGGGSFEPISSRWPKAEVLALIKLRSGLESRYQEAGPKGPLWDEISAGMQRMGYKRSAKRCKEKWENINKYYKKVKESNKERPEDAKTCPYFHELDALYRKKIQGGSSSTGGSGNNVSFLYQINRPQQQENIELDPSDAPETIPPPQPRPPHGLASTDSENKNGASTDVRSQTSNMGLPEGIFGEGIEGAPKKKTL
ncbi:hypothetical protein F2P56_020305 [Juglans regia]|uniref:Trihelix transcription factor GTL1-like isoform X2 n=2 Tax=Juglans regia TaxID=51240 RepID=A0A2I4DQE7_JUGRE|nr:trihelix transcription factor GTL1-like isoform X2 [Juglans regia]KAF5460441.1 hypothetical protein F2P56_020305 [Juglans regia]